MRLPLLVLLLLATLTILNTGFLPAPGAENCLECHAVVLEKLNKHAATKKCGSCHESNGLQHPSTGVKGFKFVEEMPALCYQCHDTYEKKNLHPPVAKGKCLGCHEAHSSDNEKLLKYPKATLCLECHDVDMTGKKSQHKAVIDGNCQACHDTHESDYKKLLKSDNSSLCFTCHEQQKQLTESLTVHAPFQRNCMICHNGHSSDEPRLLREKTPDLCAGCHEDVMTVATESTHTHPGMKVKKNCMNCHSPHASAEKNLLIAEEEKVCITCHNKSVSAENKPMINIRQLLQNSPYTHGKIAKMNCSSCHIPHGSNNHPILSGSYPVGGYATDKKESFPLCFNCHNSSLLMQQTSETATGFRNGLQNLHYLHIQGSKNRNCSNCHNVHGSQNPYLIAEKVIYGKWEMPIRFMVLQNGGSCAPGCHGERTYKRQ